jgi:hypothetical protein
MFGVKHRSLIVCAALCASTSVEAQPRPNGAVVNDHDWSVGGVLLVSVDKLANHSPSDAFNWEPGVEGGVRVARPATLFVEFRPTADHWDTGRAHGVGYRYIRRENHFGFGAQLRAATWSHISVSAIVGALLIRGEAQVVSSPTSVEKGYRGSIIRELTVGPYYGLEAPVRLGSRLELVPRFRLATIRRLHFDPDIVSRRGTHPMAGVTARLFF